MRIWRVVQSCYLWTCERRVLWSQVTRRFVLKLKVDSPRICHTRSVRSWHECTSLLGPYMGTQAELADPSWSCLIHESFDWCFEELRTTIDPMFGTYNNEKTRWYTILMKVTVKQIPSHKTNNFTNFTTIQKQKKTNFVKLQSDLKQRKMLLRS